MLRRLTKPGPAPGRAVARVCTMAAAVLLAVVAAGSPALAHDPIEQALARGAPPAWTLLVAGGAAAAAMLATRVLVVVRRHRAGPGRWPRHWAGTAQLLALWVLLGSWQAWTARTAGTPGLLLDLGYLVLPASLVTVWVFVFANYRPSLRLVLGSRPYRWLAAALTTAFTVLFLWAGSLIDVPDADDLPPPDTPAFLHTSAAYGPLAIWPNIEFWLPSPQIFGAVSVGTAMVMLTLAALAGLTWTSLAATLTTRLRDLRYRQTGAWAVLGSLGTNVCCCCTPAIYPLLAGVFGTSAAASVSVWLVGSASPLYHPTHALMIAAMLVALHTTHKRLASRPPGPPLQLRPRPVVAGRTSVPAAPHRAPTDA